MRENYKGQRFLHFLIMTHIDDAKCKILFLQESASISIGDYCVHNSLSVTNWV